MHTADGFISTLFELKKEGRERITTLDLSYNENLELDSVTTILSYLPNLTNLKLKGFGWQHLPPNLFKDNKGLKMLDLSDNDLVCIRGVLTKLTQLKKLIFKNNPDEFISSAGGKTKAKKGNVAKTVDLLNNVPAHRCIYV